MTKISAKILDGRKLSEKLAGALSKEIRSLKVKPKLVIIQVGELEESNTYIRNKKIFAERIGVEAVHKKYPTGVSQKKIVSDIVRFNSDKAVHGIIVQMPIPVRLNADAIIEAIDSGKDVDGMTSRNVKLLYENRESFVPATTKGIILLLARHKINPAGKKVVIVGHSILVGKPTILAMLNRNATVTVCHRRTSNLETETRSADILIVAVGRPKLISKKHVSRGQVVVDIGINVGKNKKIVGDVDFEKVKKIVSAITPVPGGVGPMTVVSLFQNLLVAVKRQK